MCGAGDRAERDLLRAGRLSKRLAQLRALLEVVDRDAPEARRIAALHDSFDALAAVQRRDPATVAELLSGPQVGAWVAACLRGLGNPNGRQPLPTHLAQLGSVAAAAAFRCGIEMSVRVPVRAGIVSLPSVGRAFVDRREGWVSCATGRAGLLLDAKPPDRWEPVRQLSTTAGGVELRTQLDELDPYWDTFGMPIGDRLTDAEVERWQRVLDGAWALLAARHQDWLETIAGAIRCLVPVSPGDHPGAMSASAVDAQGAVALSPPANPTRLAATLIHEAQHHRLYALHDLRPLYREPGRRGLYSPWRNDARPFHGLVHGALAFLGVADFWRRERTDPAAEFEYARLVRQLRTARRTLAGAPELTPFGASLVDRLGASIDGLPAEPADAEIRRLTDDLVAEHHAGWRLRNIVPTEPALRTITEAWARGEPPETGAVRDEATTVAAPSGDNPLARLAMAWLTDRDGVRSLAENHDAFQARFPGTFAADPHLVAGDYAAARRICLARIAAGAADDRTWAVLAVAHGRRCAEPIRSPLVRRPELVRAAWQRLAPTNEPGALIRLMSRYEAGTSTSDSIRW